MAMASVIDNSFRLRLHLADGNNEPAIGVFLTASSTLQGLIQAGRAADRRQASALLAAYSVTELMPAGQMARMASADATIRMQQRLGLGGGRGGGRGRGNNNNNGSGALAARNAGGARQQ